MLSSLQLMFGSQSVFQDQESVRLQKSILILSGALVDWCLLCLNLISLLEGESCAKNGDVVSYLIGHLLSSFACASRCQSKLQNFQTNRIIFQVAER